MPKKPPRDKATPNTYDVVIHGKMDDGHGALVDVEITGTADMTVHQADVDNNSVDPPAPTEKPLPTGEPARDKGPKVL